MTQSIDDIHNFSIDTANREIYVNRNRHNSEDSDIDNLMSSVFVKNIRALDHKPAPILIHLNAGGGGNWEDGMAMYDAILFAESYITVLVYGHACSMSSIIPQAADLRVVMPNSYMMCHYGEESLNDAHVNFQMYSRFSIKLRQTMISIYANRMKDSAFVKDKNPKDKLKYSENYIGRKLKDGDWYLTAEDMIYYGFADDILGHKFKSVRELK